MSQKIYNALKYNEDRLPQEGMAIVNSSRNCGYTALFNIMRLFHPSLVTNSVKESNTEIPYQKRNETFDAWSKRAEYARLMAAFLDDSKWDLGDTIIQDRYISKLRNSEKIDKLVQMERYSPNPNDKLQYTSVSFLPNLRHLDSKCSQSSSEPRSELR